MRVRYALGTLARFTGFVGSLGAAWLCGWLMLAAHFHALEIAEFQIGPAGMDSRTFMTLTFATLSLSWLAIAGGFLAALGRRIK